MIILLIHPVNRIHNCDVDDWVLGFTMVKKLMFLLNGNIVENSTHYIQLNLFFKVSIAQLWTVIFFKDYWRL